MMLRRIAIIGLLVLGSRSAAAQTGYLVTGQVIDSQFHTPVPSARVRVPAFAIDTASDSAGRFQTPLETIPGCYVFRFRMIGYAATDRTVRLDTARIVDLGFIPLRAAPIPEWAALYLQGCKPTEPVRFEGALAVDTLVLTN